MESQDRVRARTSEGVNISIDREIESSVRRYATRSRTEITRRIEELDREWGMERWSEANASAIAFTGVALAALHSKKWLIVPGVASALLFRPCRLRWQSRLPSEPPLRRCHGSGSRPV